MVDQKDRLYFQRVAEQNRMLIEIPPASLQEAFDRLAKISASVGTLMENPERNNDGDLQSHLAYLKRLRSIDPDYVTTHA